MSIECYYERADKKAKDINIALGIFFPFPVVNYQHYGHSISEELQLLDESEFCLVLAKKGRMEKLFATPMENNESFISGNISKRTPLSLIGDKFWYDQYAVFLQKFCLIPRDKITISSRWNEIPIISSIYNTFNELYDNKYAPISLSIMNNTDSIIGLRIMYYLSEYGVKGSEQISIRARQQMNINLKPELSEKELRGISEITRTLCRVKIINKYGECLWDDSNTITILPRETFVPELTNEYGDWKVKLSSYIARWVTPHAPCIDEIIASAGVKKGMSGTLSGNTEVILRQMKDIYDQIAKNIRYITRSMSYGEEWYRTQRVCLPSTTMRLMSGNCIDLSVLLASCYEALNFDVGIVMLRDHAFLTVCLNENYSEYIECTYMGKYEFSEATNKGREEYEENFNSDNSPKTNENIIVSIKHSRKCNILPME